MISHVRMFGCRYHEDAMISHGHARMFGFSCCLSTIAKSEKSRSDPVISRREAKPNARAGVSR